jgi:type IV pilus assembly protein PilO
MKLLFEIINSRKKSVISIFILLLGNALLFYYTSSIQQAKVETLQNDMLEKRRQGPLGRESKISIYSQGMRDMAVFRSGIAPKKDFTRVVGALYDDAANNNLHIVSVGYKPELIKEERLLVYNLNFSINGSYAAIKSFISDIERTRELLFIDHLVLNSANTTQEAVSLKIQLSAYFSTEGQ